MKLVTMPSERKRLLVDVDGCVAALMEGMCDYIATYYNVAIDVANIDVHNRMGESPNLKNEDDALRKRFPTAGNDGGIGGALAEYMSDRDCYQTWVKPIAGSVDAIARLRQHVDIVFVTANMKKVPQNYTSKFWWLKRFFDGIPVVSCPSDLKHNFRGDWVVEDRWDTCQRFFDVGVTPFLFNQPWNEAPDSVMRYDWKMIEFVVMGDINDE